MLCSICEETFSEPRKLTIGTYYPWLHDHASFKAARDAGCQICHCIFEILSYASPKQRSLFGEVPLNMTYAFKVLNADWAQHGKGGKWLGVDTSDLDEWHDEARIYIDRLQGDQSLVHLAGLLSQNSEELFAGHLRFWLVMDFYCAGPRIILPLEITPDHPNEEITQSQLNQQSHTGSPENMRLASSWLADCTATHQECRSAFECSRWLPTRLLEVGITEAPVLRVVHSVELSGKTGIPKFAALSHCWGDVQHTSLLSNNVEEYQKAIPGANLSATIRDAVHVTRNLGLGYIWIDSLCIIQDSSDDWKRESATMMEVYGGSACTIVAAKSSSGAGGCFAERNQFRIRPCKISNPFSKDTGISFCVRSQYLSEIYKREVVGSPWYKRAWVFQERVLSPRLLIFGKSQMMWACQRLQAAETWPCGKTSKNFIDTFDSFEVEKRRLLSLCSENRSVSESDTLWWSFIPDYTRSNATKSSDRIIALQGIASRIQRATGQQYVAGMWLNETLPASLLWSAASPYSMRPTVYRAPTWSWASIDGPINMEQVFISISVTYIEILRTYTPSGLHDESIDMQRENLIVSGHVLLRDLDGNTHLMIPEEPGMLSSALESDVLDSDALNPDDSNQPKDKPGLLSAVYNQSLQICYHLFERVFQALLQFIRRSQGYLLRCLEYVRTPVTFCILLLWDILWTFFLSFVWKYSLRPCCRYIKQGCMNLFNSIRWAFGYRPMSDSESITGWRNRTLSMEGPPVQDRNMHAHCKLDVQHEVDTVQQVCCLPVMERERGIGGLLLVPVAGTPCHYRRISVFQCGSTRLGDIGARRTIVLV